MSGRRKFNFEKYKQKPTLSLQEEDESLAVDRATRWLKREENRLAEIKSARQQKWLRSRFQNY
jgi:hypothetical protein